MKISNFLILLITSSLFMTQSAYSQTDVKMALDEVMRIAIENNQYIKSSRLNIEKENAIKLRSFNIPKPELFIEYEGVQGSLSNAESRKIGFLQEIEFPTNYFLRADVQSSQVQVAKEELKLVINGIQEGVKSSYNKLLLLRELLRSAEENYRIYEEFLLTAEAKYDAGATSNLEVLGAKVGKIKFENEIENLRSEIKSTKSDVKNLMNVDYAILTEGDLNFIELKLSEPDIINSAVVNNPEVKALQYRKEKFSNKISLSRGELLPDISFKYFRQKIGGQNDYWGMEVGLGVPLWFWWEQSGSIKESNYELQIASSEETGLKNFLENEISRTFEEYENNLRQAKFFRDEALNESEEILRQSKISYEEGEIGYIEYLQAINLAYETRTQYLNTIYDYNQSIINLEKLTAGELK